ncbi:hypothetical protein [Streptomyces cyslabdanicus]|uniref:hypothetical protein n=1 Tax=Streptomyces cyslabdanicus TaxID=1470456 RepID=UPI0040447D1B
MITATSAGPGVQGGIMKLFFAIPVVLWASIFAVSGVLGITRGWVIPMKLGGLVIPTNQRRVRRVRLYAWGQLVVASGLCWQLLFGWMLSAPDTLNLDFRQWWALSGTALSLVGFIVMAVSQRAGRDRQGVGML